MNILIGFILSFLISYLAYKKSSLNTSGFTAAAILGGCIYFFGGIFLSGIMIAFFISSTLLTKYGEIEKKSLGHIIEKPGANRDYLQVIAKGGLGLIYSFLYYITKDPTFIVAYSIGFAAANADTWSSEIGPLSKKSPISIITLKKATKGESGAISLLGVLAAFLGAGFIAVCFIIGYFLFLGYNPLSLYYFMFITVLGFLGSIIDSFLGVTIQGKYKCILCNIETEKKFHHGKKTIHIKGLKFINNDVVNFLSTLIPSILPLFQKLL